MAQPGAGVAGLTNWPPQLVLAGQYAGQ